MGGPAFHWYRGPPKREAGANPARTRHCVQSGAPNKATSVNGIFPWRLPKLRREGGRDNGCQSGYRPVVAHGRMRPCNLPFPVDWESRSRIPTAVFSGMRENSLAKFPCRNSPAIVRFPGLSSRDDRQGQFSRQLDWESATDGTRPRQRFPPPICGGRTLRGMQDMRE